MNFPPARPRRRMAPLSVGLALALLALAVLPVLSQETPPAPPSGEPPAVTSRERESVFAVFYATGLDTTAAFRVSNLPIRKDNMTLLLKSGIVFLMKPIDGEVTGAAFIGDGVATTAPPNAMLRYMLNKYSGAETLNEPFTEAVFRFSDGTDKAIRAAAKPDAGAADQAARAESIWKDRNAWFDGTRALHLEMQFLETRISKLTGQDFFVADFHTPKHDWLTYTFNPQEIHENVLFAAESIGASGRRNEVPWIHWHRQADYSPNGHYILNPDRDGARNLHIKSSEMTLDLPSTKEVDWEARLNIEPLVDGMRCLKFDLLNNGKPDSRWYEDGFYPVRLMSVTDGNGQPLETIHKKDELLVFLPRPVRAGEPMQLVIKGKAEVIYQVTAESYGLLQGSWYPQYGFLGGRSAFHWTVRVQKPFLITGSGKVVREFEDKEKGQNVLEIACDQPVHFPWVIFGRFQKEQGTYVSEESKRSVPLSVHSFPTMTYSITDKETLDRIGATGPITVTLSAPLKKVEGIIDEGKEILKLYEKIYGPYPYDELHIAQMGPFLGFGQAPQGFVQLTGDAFMSQARLESDFFHGFLAHEFAHQWWAHQIGWASPDDEWLSESFAEYASGIFVKEYQGAKRFQRTLQEWKKNAKVSDKESPIAAANTLRMTGGFRHRNYLLYNKGPYVVHMLRVELGDDTYVKVMRGIQESYRNRDLSTEMLLAAINKISGANYTWFFDQWFWNVGIPSFRYSWRSERQPDGKYMIIVHVSQENKANFKRVLMPVYIEFKGKKVAPQYMRVDQPEEDLKLLSPEEPKNVTLDEDNTLLADITRAN